MREAYPIMEHFYTLQGEGFHQGKAAYFVRLAGCSVGCHWCDVKDSWQTEGYPILSSENIGEEIKKYPTKIAVITGGEPLEYDMESLTKTLQTQGIKTHLETSGAYELSGNWDWICVSPKKFKSPIESIYKKANELKMVIFNLSDFVWAEQLALKVSQDCHLFLQPEWSKSEKILPEIIKYCKENPQWRISLQVHKFLNIP